MGNVVDSVLFDGCFADTSPGIAVARFFHGITLH
jgi:hypothetical protein